MLVNERQNEILTYLKNNKTANVRTLAKKLYVSEATVRRDLRALGDMGLLERCHGGALLPENTNEQSMSLRILKNAAEKHHIANTALDALPAFGSVFLDGSSTVLALAERMNLSSKTVITNNLQAALVLSQIPDINLHMLGGNVKYNSNATSGSATLRQIEGISVDLMLCSCASVKEGECAERTFELAELKRSVFVRSHKRILLVDSAKFGAFGTYYISKLTDFDMIITDKKPSDEILTLGANIIY